MAATFYRESQYFTTTLSVVGGINDTITTGIVLQSVSGIDNTAKPGIALFSYADPLDTATAEWITFTSINSTTKTLVGVTRGAEGYSAKTHANGVVVAFPHSKSHINEIAKALAGEETGVTLSSPVLSGTATGTYTLGGTPTISSPTINTPTLVLANTSPTADGSIGYDRTEEELQIGDGANSLFARMGAWKSFTPSWTNVTVGNGTNTGAYCVIGKTVHFWLKFTLGSTSSVSGLMILSFPVAAKRSGFQPVAKAVLIDTGTGRTYGHLNADGELLVEVASGTYLQVAVTSSTVPHTWAATDVVEMYGTYEAA